MPLPRVSGFKMATRIGAWRAIYDFWYGLALNNGSVGDVFEVGLQICCLGGFTRSKTVASRGAKRERSSTEKSASVSA